MNRLLLVLACWLLAATAVADELPAPVASALKAAKVPREAVAIFVQQTDQARPLLDFRADQPMNPASTMKLLTTYAGLELLGPAFTWRTQIYASTPPRDGVLQGDLIIKGYGDPALTLENFWRLLRTLRQAGVREINGDLVLDHSHFDTAASPPPGTFDGEGFRAYNATPDALLLNFKATRLLLRGDAAQNRLLISADPELPQLNIVNQASLSQAPCGNWKERLRYQVRREAEIVTITFSGSFAADCGEQALELNLFDDDNYFFQVFRQMWQEQGGTLRGTLKNGSVPPGASLLAQLDSPPLADVIRLINKYSNNVMARQLLLTLGAQRNGAPATPASGAGAVQEWLASRGMQWPELVIENGAGLSRNERISARHLGELLLTAYRSAVMPELMSSLPVVAVDGTLQRRLKNSAVAGQAHLKTGSLDGVRAIAGYLLDAKGRRWVVVFLVNHATAAGARTAQDALLEYLYALP